MWAGIVLDFANKISRSQEQKLVNDFLTSVVKYNKYCENNPRVRNFRSIFIESMSVDTLITQILNQAQKLVNADRASLFLVDIKTNQLYARYQGRFLFDIPVIISRIFDLHCEGGEAVDVSESG